MKELKEYDQWAACHVIMKCENGEYRNAKQPIVPWYEHGEFSFNDWNNPERWLPYDEAYTGCDVGKSFILSKSDPFVCIDLDHVFEVDIFTMEKSWKSKYEKLENWINMIIDKTYCEYSHSKLGMHIFIKANMPHSQYPGKPVEVFSYNKHILVTENKFSSSPWEITNQQEWFDNFCKSGLVNVKPVSTVSPTVTLSKFVSSRAMEKLCKFYIPKINYFGEGERHNVFMSLAGIFKNKGLNYDDNLTLLWKANQTRCSDPVDHEFLAPILDYLYKKDVI